MRRALLKTPVDGARISSGFGMRKHPIQGYNKMHRGVDFAAPRGTPIYAAGKGVIERIGPNGGYGKYIRIRHNSTYKTAYAHMKGFAKGMKRGVRVKQGQVIGYVGSTGRSTGPHLHYEVLLDGKQVNPLKIKLPSGKSLKGADLEAFEQARAEIDRLREQSACLRTLMVENDLQRRGAGPAGEPRTKPPNRGRQRKPADYDQAAVESGCTAVDRQPAVADRHPNRARRRRSSLPGSIPPAGSAASAGSPA